MGPFLEWWTTARLYTDINWIWSFNFHRHISLPRRIWMQRWIWPYAQRQFSKLDSRRLSGCGRQICSTFILLKPEVDGLRWIRIGAVYRKSIFRCYNQNSTHRMEGSVAIQSFNVKVCVISLLSSANWWKLHRYFCCWIFECDNRFIAGRKS